MGAGNAITSADARNLTFIGAGNITVADPIATLAGTLTKNGTGTLTLSGANTFTGATVLSGGTNTLTGANGATTSSGITIYSGATLKLENTAAANNGDRVTGPITLRPGTLDFNHTAGGADYAETLGALTLFRGSSTISASQAAEGQTSTLTFASFTRNSLTSVNFTGTGLGADTRNRIIFTAMPTLTQGIIVGATVNGTDLATYGVNGIVAYAAYTDINRLGGVILNDSTKNVRIVNGGTSGNITLGANTTAANTLTQSASDGLATVDVTTSPAQILRAYSVVVNSGASGLTIGTAANSGTLTAGVSGGELTLINHSNNDLTINSVITNNSTASSLSLAGTGTTTLSGNSTFTGNTYIGQGTTKLGAAGSGANTPLGTTNAGTIVAHGGTLDLNGISLATAETLTLRGTGVGGGGALMNSGGDATYSGLINLDSFVLTDSMVSIVAGNGNIVLSNPGTFTLGNPLTLAGSAAGSSIASTISATANSLTKTGTGTWTLSGASTRTGLTTINQGTLKLGSTGGALGTIAIGTFVTSGGALDLNGFTLVTAEPLTLTGTGVGGGGALMNSGGNATFSGPVTLAGNATITAGSGDIVLSNAGIITGVDFSLTLDGTTAGSSIASIIGTRYGTLTKTGTGTWTLSAANTYSGATTINAGTLLVNSPGSLAGSAVTVNNTGTLGGSGTVNGPVTVESGGTLQLGATGATLTLANAANPTFNAGATLKINATATTLDKIRLSHARAVFAYSNLALVIDTTSLTEDLTGVTLVDTAMGNGDISGTTFSSVTVIGNTSFVPTVHYNTSSGTITLDLKRSSATVIQFR